MNTKKSEAKGTTLPNYRRTRCLRRLLGAAVTPLLFLLVTATLCGQSALDGFDPNANHEIYAVAVQPDGKILIGGAFTSIGGQPRNYLARLNLDGTLDAAFNPNPNNTVLSIAVQADGKILVGGIFTNIGGQTRNFIARLNVTTGSADSFDPSASEIVYAVALQPDGKILAGGSFTSIGGQTRNHIARLDPTTGLADSFDPNASGDVFRIALQADGKILTSGLFDNIGGMARNRIARLDGMTGLADSFNPNASGTVFAMAVQADGKILVGGQFNGVNSIGGQTRNYIARLDATTGLADSFDPSANGTVWSIAVQADGKILAGGFFFGASSIGGQTRNRIARLDAATGLADSFDPNASADVKAIAIQADGKILAAGFFNGPNSIAGQTRNYIARLETDGRVDQTLNLGIVGGYVFTTAVQPDGKILIGGSFTTVLGVTRHNIARLNTDGTLDTLFNPNASDTVYAIVAQADGKILAAGFFNGANSIGGQTRNRIARLDGTTGLADSFNPNASDVVHAIAVQTDGKILAAGYFMRMGGLTRNFLARLDPTTGLPDSFDPNPNNPVYAIAVQADGKILVGGGFNGANSIGGQMRNYIARLEPATGLADSFDPNASFDVDSIAVQPDGKILAGGLFSGPSSIGGQTRNHIARLDPTTGLADSFDPSASADVFTIAVQADGKILVGGGFNGPNSIGGQMRNFIARLNPTTGLADTFNPNSDNFVLSIVIQADGKILVGGESKTIGGQSRSLFARLTNDKTAVQDLAVTQGTITWTLGGSGPQFTRVTFESSTDNLNYAPLGDGTATGSTWILTGLNLPTEQNIYIRARGYHRGGSRNGSESITESVRNAFFAPPTITSANNTTFTVGTAGTFSVTTTGVPTGVSMSITESGALPAGVTFTNNNNGTATLAGTPNPGTGGSYPITITANNGVSPNASQNFTLTVNQPPAITSANHVTFSAGVPGTFSVTTTGFPTGAGMSINESGALPTGVTFVNNNNGTATFGGTPGTAGTYPLIITANNGVAPNATQNFTLTVIAPTPTPTPSVPPTTLGNISTRLRVETGENVLIGGFIVTGTQPKRVILRAIGPSLPVAGALADPILELRDSSGVLIRSNDNWRSDQESEIIATTIPPSNDLESAIVAILPANNSAYTATVRGVNDGTGVGLVEAYDLDRTVDSKLANISTRGLVQTEENVLIAGTIVLGQAPQRVLVRAIGPSLPVAGKLEDPVLELRDGNGTLIRSNDNWRSDQEAEIIATTIPPSNDLESALIEILPGNGAAYTATVRGVNNGTGVGLVEVYALN